MTFSRCLNCNETFSSYQVKNHKCTNNTEEIEES